MLLRSESVAFGTFGSARGASFSCPGSTVWSAGFGFFTAPRYDVRGRVPSSASRP